jgi:hypothetical protein
MAIKFRKRVSFFSELSNPMIERLAPVFVIRFYSFVILSAPFLNITASSEISAGVTP